MSNLENISPRTGWLIAEAVLWNQLKSRKLEDRKFRRQQSINRYIVDFYYPSIIRQKINHPGQEAYLCM